jgi:hypothetical protein
MTEILSVDPLTIDYLNKILPLFIQKSSTDSVYSTLSLTILKTYLFYILSHKPSEAITIKLCYFILKLVISGYEITILGLPLYLGSLAYTSPNVLVVDSLPG